MDSRIRVCQIGYAAHGRKCAVLPILEGTETRRGAVLPYTPSPEEERARALAADCFFLIAAETGLDEGCSDETKAVEGFSNQTDAALGCFEQTVFSESSTETAHLSNVVYKGRMCEPTYDDLSGQWVQIADFSAFQTEGAYYLLVPERNAGSVRFEICKSPYRSAAEALLGSFYYQRCGTALPESYAGAYARSRACHCAPAISVETPVVYAEVSGGWHDAGDFGRYTVAGAVAVAHLLYTYALYPNAQICMSTGVESYSASVRRIAAACAADAEAWLKQESACETGAARHQTASSPHRRESAYETAKMQRLPWLLAEAKVELDFLLKMQRTDGAVWHKVTTWTFASFGRLPEEDRGQLYLFPVSTCATADFAAVMALAAQMYAPFLPTYAAQLSEAAQAAGAWLCATPEFVQFHNPEGVLSGEYGDANPADELFWAFTELYRLTGRADYLERVRIETLDTQALTAFGWGEVGGFGALAWLLHTGFQANCAEAALCRSAFLEQAEKQRAVSNASAYYAPLARKDFRWGSNMDLMTHAMIFSVAYACLTRGEMTSAAADMATCEAKEMRIVEGLAGEQQRAAASAAMDRAEEMRAVEGLTGEQRAAAAAQPQGANTVQKEAYVSRAAQTDAASYAACAEAAFHYLYGENPTAVSFVTGSGPFACNYVHHRQFDADGIDACAPGLVVGGANGGRRDACANALLSPDTPPAYGYVDETESYSTNEVAIYWNSPAVFVAAFLETYFV